MGFLVAGNTVERAPFGAQIEGAFPAGTFEMTFNERSGSYSYVRKDNLQVGTKVFGPHQKIADKVFTSWQAGSSSMGVLLEGVPGSGKSLTARVIAELAYAQHIPVVLVSDATPNLARELSSLPGPMVIIFDEFEKVFPVLHGDAFGPQNEFLPLFDGIHNQNHLYVLTSNSAEGISRYILGRPGRVRYHFHYPAMSREELEQYVSERLGDVLTDQAVINHLIGYALVNEWTYDVMNVLTSELKAGYGLMETLRDMNMPTVGSLTCSAQITYQKEEEGESKEACDSDTYLHLLGTGERLMHVEDDDSRDNLVVVFQMSDLQYNLVPGGVELVVPKDKLVIRDAVALSDLRITPFPTSDENKKYTPEF